jgi:antitoxin component YwqK of YwqJK toxin-antitoxin module
MMIRRILLLCTCCIFLPGFCKSQDYKFIYYLGADLSTVPKTKALIIGKGFNDTNGFRLDCYSALNNALLMTWHFTDSSLADINGSFRSYYRNGKIEKEGNYVNGLEDGVWQTWDSLAKKTDSVFYKNGLPYVKAAYLFYHKDGSLSSYSLKDSLQDTYHYISYNEKKEIITEAFFKGQKGILKTYETGNVRTDSLFTREEVEATFPGGDIAWREYLERNLNRDVAVDNKAPAGIYKAVIKFVVSKDGKLEDIVAETNIGYGIEQEAIRVIKKSPKWIPAVQFGRKVRAYRRQPVSISIDNGDD